MKKTLIILLFLIVHCTLKIEDCKAQWIWQNLKPYSYPISDFCLFNANTLIAFGYPSAIIKTSDGGNSWINMTNYSNHFYFYSYSYFLNENTGWIQAGDWAPLKIFKTTDGGKNWTIFNNSFTLKLLKFLDDNTGYSISSGVIKTTNSGVNWNSTNFPPNNIQWTGLDFIDINTGWVVGYLTSPYPDSNYILKTTNGGINWTHCYPGFSTPGIQGVKFVNAMTGWIYGETGKVRKTTNGGVDWFIQPCITTAKKLHFYNDQTGWIVPYSNDSTIIRTTNGGLNWVQIKIPIRDVSCLKFFDQNTGFIFGGTDSKQIIKSTNGGQNWFFLSSGIFKEINSIYFSDANYGWAVGGGYNYLRTTNGGNDWFLENNDLQGIYPLQDVYFKDQQTGWLLTGSKVLKTTNSGFNWITQYDTSIIGGVFNNFSFKNENEIFIPRGYCIFRSSDGGANWFRQYINNGNFWINRIKFFSGTNGWLMSNFHYPDSSKVFKTTDGGQSWIENLKTGTIMNNMYFLNSNTGWITASKDPSYTIQNLVYKTTNGGLNWISYIHPDTIFPSFDKIFFENENSGICIGANYLHKTTNGGINWSSYCMIAETFSSLFFLNSQTGWISGNYGTILKTTDGCLTWTNKISSSKMKNYILFQNYPNPFNPTTNIHYEIPKSGFVKLVVFDILGREIQTLVNEKQNAGSYEVTFNARQPGLGSNLSSGIYFYTLSVGDFNETKKFVLLK